MSMLPRNYEWRRFIRLGPTEPLVERWRFSPFARTTIRRVATMCFSLFSVLFGRKDRPKVVVLLQEKKQRQPMELAVRRTYDELAPTLAAGLSVAKVVVKSTIHRPVDGEFRWLVATDEREGPPAHAIWLAFRPDGKYIGPEGVAAILADALLTLAEREGAMTPLVGQPVAAPVLKDKDSAGVAPRPRTAAKKEADETLVEFRPSPIGHDALTPNGA
jgi:hypothetical protein